MPIFEFMTNNRTEQHNEEAKSKYFFIHAVVLFGKGNENFCNIVRMKPGEMKETCPKYFVSRILLLSQEFRSLHLKPKYLSVTCQGIKI